MTPERYLQMTVHKFRGTLAGMFSRKVIDRLAEELTVIIQEVQAESSDLTYWDNHLR